MRVELRTPLGDYCINYVDVGIDRGPDLIHYKQGSCLGIGKRASRLGSHFLISLVAHI